MRWTLKERTGREGARDCAPRRRRTPRRARAKVLGWPSGRARRGSCVGEGRWLVGGTSAQTQRATPAGDPPRQLNSALHPPRSPRARRRAGPAASGTCTGTRSRIRAEFQRAGAKDAVTRGPVTPDSTRRPAHVSATAAPRAKVCGSGPVGGPQTDDPCGRWGGHGGGAKRGGSAATGPGSHELEVTRRKPATAPRWPAGLVPLCPERLGFSAAAAEPVEGPRYWLILPRCRPLGTLLAVALQPRRGW